MSNFPSLLRATAAAALAGIFATLGAATAAADPDTGNPADVDALGAALSPTYSAKDCTPQPPATGQLAVLACGPSSDPNGPVQAIFTLFANANDLTNAFNARIKADALTPCGDSGETPTIWRQGSAGATAGQVACGTRQGAAEIIWTTDAKHVMSDVRGPSTDVNALYQWWRNYG